MATSYAVTDDTTMAEWEGRIASAFLSMSLLCCVELAVLTPILWNKHSKIYFCSITLATLSSLCFTIGIVLYFFAPPNDASQWVSVLLSCIGYWIYTPAEFTAMYTRLHLLRPARKVMLACKIVLIAQWVLVTTPNATLSFGALISTGNKFAYAYSITQRIEPVIYTFVSIMLSSLYVYYAFIMFKTYGDGKVRFLLIRLLYANMFLIVLGVGNIVAEFVGGGVVQSTYVAFLYSFQLKIELWMLNEIGLLASETLERSRILKPLNLESSPEF